MQKLKKICCLSSLVYRYIFAFSQHTSLRLILAISTLKNIIIQLKRKSIVLLYLFVSIFSIQTQTIFSQSKKILISACNNLYFDSCLTLISSCHKTSFDIIDHIIIYNLDLDKKFIEIVESIEKVEVRYFEQTKKNIPEIDIDDFYKNPKQHAYKAVCLIDASYNTGDLVFWLDAGGMLLKSAQKIFEDINNEDIFLVDFNFCRNCDWTHHKCIEIMNASPQELRDAQISSGIMGFKVGGKYQHMMEDALKYH